MATLTEIAIYCGGEIEEYTSNDIQKHEKICFENESELQAFVDVVNAQTKEKTWAIIVFILIILTTIYSMIAVIKELVVPEPVQEIPTVIVRIVDDNRVIHSREGMLMDGVVTVELSGK